MSAVIEPASSAPIHNILLAEIDQDSKCYLFTFVHYMCFSVVRLMLEVRYVKNLLAVEIFCSNAESVLHCDVELFIVWQRLVLKG